MGNVVSSMNARPTTRCDAPPAPPPLPSHDGGSSPPSEGGMASGGSADSIAQVAAAVSAYSNPGPYEQASLDAKRLVMLETFDGFRCDISKQLSPFMAVIHSFQIPNSGGGGGGGGPMGGGGGGGGSPGQYSFIGQVVDEQGIIMSRVDPTRGAFDGRLQRMVLGGLAMAKLQVGVSQDGSSDQLLAELDIPTAQTWSANFKYGSMAGGLVWGCNYWQAITPKLAMGGEGMYVQANGNLVSSYTLKYNFQAPLSAEEQALGAAPSSSRPAGPPGAPPPEPAGSSSVLLQYNGQLQQPLTIQYRRVVTPGGRVTVASELQMHPLLAAPTQVLVGAEFGLARSRLQFAVSGTGQVQSLLEARMGMGPQAPRLLLTADVNHFAKEFKFGYGINIDG